MRPHLVILSRAPEEAEYQMKHVFYFSHNSGDRHAHATPEAAIYNKLPGNIKSQYI